VTRGLQRCCHEVKAVERESKTKGCVAVLLFSEQQHFPTLSRAKRIHLLSDDLSARRTLTSSVPQELFNTMQCLDRTEKKAFQKPSYVFPFPSCFYEPNKSQTIFLIFPWKESFATPSETLVLRPVQSAVFTLENIRVFINTKS
jgi:hypothetical protein